MASISRLRPGNVPSQLPAKKSSLGKLKTILRAKTQKASVLYEGKNVTPKPLNPQIYIYARERQLSTFDGSQDVMSGTPRASSDAGDYKKMTLKFKAEQYQPDEFQTRGSIFVGGTGTDFSDPTDFIVERRDSVEVDASISSDLSPGIRKQSFEEDIDQQAEIKMKSTTPTHISLILNETDTFFVLDLPSSTAPRNTEEGDLVDVKNQEYEYLTEGKGRNRKVLNAEVQTVPVLQKTRDTVPEPITNINDATFVSQWDMYDTYKEEEIEGSSETGEESGDSYDEEVHKLDELTSLDSYKMSNDERQMTKLVKNNKFLEAVCVIERLLANNYFNEQQKRFRGLSDPYDLRENIEYKYRLNLLWTFANDITKGRCVTAMQWNPHNEDLLAVGYGKFYFAENKTGLVLIWNMKNPVQPERQYNFKYPVTTLSFSNKDPKLLAVGFYVGYIVVLNVLSREKLVAHETTPCFEPVWCILWKENTDQIMKKEDMWTASDDGRVLQYSIHAVLQIQQQQLMRVAKADGKLKGYDPMRKCSNLNIPVSRYAAALFLEPHPTENTNYYVGTNEGVIHKCSSNYLNQHLDLFMAHDGPVNAMKHSPFSTKIFATCGDDWYIRLWAEGIVEPLHELFVTMQSVQGIAWSPTHSTILASIYGKTILLWDFQRKVYEPQSISESPTNCRNTVVHFIKSGRCLVVGDIEGHVHVFSLEDMPFPAFFQENLLFQSFKRSLITKPELRQTFKKVVQKSPV